MLSIAKMSSGSTRCLVSLRSLYKASGRWQQSPILAKSSLSLNSAHLARPMSGLSDKAAGGNSGPGLSVEVKDNVRTIKFNRPEKRNAITSEMYDAIRVALTEANTDDTTRIIVMTGTGDYFCSGNDLGNFTISEDIKALAEEGRIRFHAFAASYIECQKPIIVLANGPAIGIGVTIFGLADIVYASERAYFSTPFTSLGQTPEACSSYTFPRIMGNAKLGNSKPGIPEKRDAIGTNEKESLPIVSEKLPKLSDVTEEWGNVPEATTFRNEKITTKPKPQVQPMRRSDPGVEEESPPITDGENGRISGEAELQRQDPRVRVSTTKEEGCVRYSLRPRKK